ncbi:MAG: TAXI family TRAP transporter solute-binding subunit [Cytophagales bacterium]|nr:TAXI family TRAP transporter solute-binding subunit [Cytophagales bacterium]
MFRYQVLLLLLFTLFSCQEEKQHFKVATSSKGGSYYTIGTQISALFNQKHPNTFLEVVSNDTLSSSVNCQLLLDKKVDFALCQNDVSFSHEGVQKVHINSILPLYPEICFIIFPDSLNPQSLRELIVGKRIGLGPKNSGTANFMTHLFKHFGILPSEYTPIYTGFDENLLSHPDIDVSCAMTGFNNQRIQRILTEQNGKLFSLDQQRHLFDNGSSVDGFCLLYPRSKKFIIPKKLYQIAPEEPILTVAVDAILLTHSDTPQELINEFTQTIIHNSQLLSNKNSLLGQLSENFDTQRLNFPLHEGARIYYERDKPSFFERYAEMIGVVFSIFVVLVGAISSIQKFWHQRQKDLIDEFYIKVIKIENRTKNFKTVEDCIENIEKVRELKNEAFLLLVREKVRADESFRIFISQANDTIRYIESKRQFLRD